MKYNELLGQVQHRGRMSSRREAERAVEATLSTLSARLAGGAAENLAAQLPPEAQEYLQGGERAEELSVGEFLASVGQRAGIDDADSAWQTRVVLEVLQEAVSAGTLDKLRAQLPEEFDALFEAGSAGELDLPR
jgi:uncharacterized protein (DUF2267 family)